MKTVAITGIGAINSVISGSSQFAQASASSFGRASARGQKLIAIATTIDRPFAQVVLRKEIAEAGGYDAKAPLEKRGALLKGRTIAVDSINSMIHAYVRLVAARAGVNPDDIRIAPMAPASMLAAFQSKQIDGYAMSLPWPQKAVQDGEALLIASGPDGEPGDMIPFGHNMIVTKQDTCEKRKTLCMAMGQSIKDADRLHQDQAGRGLRAVEEALSDARRQTAEGLVRGTAKGHAIAADGQQGRHREFGEIQRRCRPAQGRREAEILRRPVHQRVRAMMMRPALLAAAILALATAPLAAQPALEDIIIAMPNFTFTSTPNFIAEELGLWAKHGLRVKIIQIAGVGATNAVIAGSADFVQAGGSTLTRAAARGQRLLAIANTAERNIVAITMRKEVAEAAGFDAKAPIEKRARCCAAKPSASAQSTPIRTLISWPSRRSGGVKPDELRVTALEGNAMWAAFQSKQIDGMSNSPPWPLKPVVDGAVGGDRQRPGRRPAERRQLRLQRRFWRSPKPARSAGEFASAVGQVMKEAIAYMHTHPAEVIAILGKKFPNLEPKLIAAAFEEILKSTPKVPVVTKEALDNADDFNVEAGMMKASDKLKSYDGLYTDEFVK